jgi:hypothetical protein
MSGVFRNIDPPPLHRLVSVYFPVFGAGEDTLAGWRGGGGSIVRKTPDTALYSIDVLVLCGIILRRAERETPSEYKMGGGGG